MNEVLKCIRERRSCRSFKSEQIKDDELQAIIDAGLWAPSGNNKQPWFFTVVKNKSIIETINEYSKENAKKYLTDPKRLALASNKDFDLFYNAPLLIIISGEPKSGTMMADCSAAIQNMLLAAESMNIGSLWNGIIKRFWFDTEGVADFIKKCDIPEGYQPLYAVAFGYKAKDNADGPPRREGLVKIYE
ncbi:MAG: nitroreductase family protein [Candidatus Delongbacteria bacterium]|nr:nitroreductase family protein [Candidatus Delongbacteria bacterium]